VWGGSLKINEGLLICPSPIDAILDRQAPFSVVSRRDDDERRRERERERESERAAAVGVSLCFSMLVVKHR